jgi:hypothetical protein
MIHLTVHLHTASEAHLPKVSERLVHKTVIIFEETSERIFSSEEVLENIVSVPHVEIMEILILEMMTTKITTPASTSPIGSHSAVFYIFSAVRVIILSFLSIT